MHSSLLEDHVLTCVGKVTGWSWRDSTVATHGERHIAARLSGLQKMISAGLRPSGLLVSERVPTAQPTISATS